MVWFFSQPAFINANDLLLSFMLSCLFHLLKCQVSKCLGNTIAHDNFIHCIAISLHSFWQAFGILEKGISIAVTWITSLTIFNIQNRFDASAAEDFQNHCSKSNITKSFVFCHNAFNFIRKFYFIYFQYLFTKRFQCRLLHMCCTWEMVKCIIKNASVILIILGFQNTVNKQVIFPP